MTHVVSMKTLVTICIKKDDSENSITPSRDVETMENITIKFYTDGSL